MKNARHSLGNLLMQKGRTENNTYFIDVQPAVYIKHQNDHYSNFMSELFPFCAPLTCSFTRQIKNSFLALFLNIQSR